MADKQLDQALAAEGMAILNVKSVYDTDGQNLMGTRMLVAGENIPMTSPPPDDSRSQVADLARMKDPAQTTAEQRPGRFVRVSQAVPTPRGLSREAIGETDLEMQHIIGYVPLEPDGSFRIKVPADTPLGLTVVDADGRAFQTHTNWIQARPGETRTCNGCHSPRRGSAINSAPIAGFHPNTLLTAESGESMAETLTRLDPTALEVKPDMVFTDVWTDPAAGHTGSGSGAGLQRPARWRAGSGRRHRQLPGSHPAAVGGGSRRRHLHQLPQQQRPGRPGVDGTRSA